MSLGKRVMHGAALLALMRFSTRIIGLLSTLILARILLPEDFGIVGLAVAYMAIIDGLATINVNSAIIRIRDDDRSLYDTAWSIGLCRTLFIVIVISISAQFIPDFVNEPRLENVIYAILLLPFLQGIKNPKFIQYEKQLKYRPLFTAAVISKLLSAIITVTIAVIYQSYWALITGMIIRDFIDMVMSYILAPYRPKISFARFKEIFGFTAWLSGATLFSTLGQRLDSLIIGSFLDTRFVGYYRVGEELTTLPTTEFVSPLTRTFFPAFSELAHDADKLRTNALEASSMIAVASLPTTIGFAFLAHDIVQLLVGERWLIIVPMIQILTPILGLQMVFKLSNALCMASGRPSLLFKAEGFFTVLRLAIVLIAISLAGFIGIIIGRGIASLLRIFIELWLIRTCLCTDYFAPLLNAGRSIISASIMIVVLLLTDALITGLWPENEMLKALTRVAFFAPLGAALYISSHLILWQASGRPDGPEQRILALIKPLMSRS